MTFRRVQNSNQQKPEFDGLKRGEILLNKTHHSLSDTQQKFKNPFSPQSHSFSSKVKDIKSFTHKKNFFQKQNLQHIQSPKRNL